MDMKKPFTLVFLGRSGCGKGEQVKRLEKVLKPTLTIHTGARFREFAKHKTLAGRIARGIIGKGFLAPTWFAEHMWINVLMDELDEKKNVIFDGSPRLRTEAEFLDEVLEWFGRKNVLALYIDVSEKEATRRLLLRKRGDDYSAAIKNRLAYFKRDVVPSLNYYKKTGRLIRIDGEQSMEDVFADIRKALKV